MKKFGKDNPHYKHMLSHTAEYKTWGRMKSRCTNNKLSYWKNYGGRGISYDPRWNEFLNFLADMGPRPSQDHSLDRINNDGNYSKENCRWATRSQQVRNRRPNFAARGEKQHLSKLTTESVLAIRSAEAKHGYIVLLSKKFGVSKTAIGYIRRRVTWKHI